VLEDMVAVGWAVEHLFPPFEPDAHQLLSRQGQHPLARPAQELKREVRGWG
jgi:hypothetical protein